jgi:hypothetical protein
MEMVKMLAALAVMMAGCANNQPCSVIERDHPGGQTLTGEGMPSRGIELADDLYVPKAQRQATGLQDITYCEAQ